MTVIRRIHSSNFTIVGNACLNDVRLTAEGLGVICYLIGRPNNWRMRVSQLADRFECGRDKIMRIVKELIEAGYIRKISHRDAVTGMYRGVDYIILDTADEPLPENTEVDENCADDPVLENQESEKPTLINTESIKTDSKKRATAKAVKPGEYTEEFENLVWKPYPRKLNASKKNAFKQYNRLPHNEQQLVISSIPIFAARMKAEGRAEDKIKHLEFYISGRIFETVAPTASEEARRGPETASRYDWAVILLVSRSSNNWRLTWGPEPGRPGCHVPADMLTMSDTDLRTIPKVTK